MYQSIVDRRLFVLAVSILLGMGIPSTEVFADCVEGSPRSTTPEEIQRYEELHERLALLCSGPAHWQAAPKPRANAPSTLCPDAKGRATLRVGLQRKWVDLATRETETKKLQREMTQLQKELEPLQKKLMANPGKGPDPRMQAIFRRFDAMDEERRAIDERTTVSMTTTINDTVVYLPGGERSQRKGAPIVVERRSDDQLRLLFLHGPWTVDEEGTWTATIDRTKPTTRVQTISVQVRGRPQAVEALLATCKLSSLASLLGR